MASIKQLKAKGMVTGMEFDKSVPAMEQCLACILVKQHVTPYTQESKMEIVVIGDLTVGTCTNYWNRGREVFHNVH